MMIMGNKPLDGEISGRLEKSIFFEKIIKST